MKSLVLAPFSEKGLARVGALGSVTHEPWTRNANAVGSGGTGRAPDE